MDLAVQSKALVFYTNDQTFVKFKYCHFQIFFFFSLGDWELGQLFKINMAQKESKSTELKTESRHRRSKTTEILQFWTTQNLQRPEFYH